MEMFLMVAALSMLGVAVSAALFAAATREERAEPQKPTVRAPVVSIARPQFFAEGTASAAPRVPIEAILLEIERHVQLEQAAAESFLHAPTVERLHGRTMSRLVH
jgi:hypothetical protein